MRAFKFRSVEKIEYSLDILLNARLHCADWRELNDPMEGSFRYARSLQEREAAKSVETFIDRVVQRKFELKVCSLSEHYQSPVLWAHYASEFRGLAIEVALDENRPEIRQVHYHQSVFRLQERRSLGDREHAMDVLSAKLNPWNYEGEVRVIQSGDYYELERPIASIIIGPRMQESLSDTLRVLCHQLDIPVYQLEYDDGQISRRRLQPLIRPKTRIPRPRRRSVG